MTKNKKSKILPATDMRPHIPDFQLIARCGRGGTGEVWEAVDLDGIHRAVRLVSYDGSKMPVKYRRKDARSIALYRQRTDNHENLQEILHHGRTEKYSYYITCLADNLNKRSEQYIPDTLAERLKRKKKFSSEEILNIMLAVANAIEYLHACRVAHLDLKPENIIFSKGVLKIVDMGLAGECDETYLPSSGTLEYMPKRPCSGRARDIFAVGMILYCLYSGNSPEDFPEIGEEVDMDEIRLFNEIALKCCTYTPVAEYKDASALKKDLLKLQKIYSENRQAETFLQKMVRLVSFWRS
ncbi:MAG: protein kinase [Lentisphaeria bacterium]|nr:protein kinase [Lentisphaeria bacterium]